MGLIKDWLNGVFGKGHTGTMKYAPAMSGYSPTFSAFGDNIYASDIVVQAIRVGANEMMKLQPRHIRTEDGKQMSVTDSSVSRVLRNPNEYMTTADFLSKIYVLRELTKNCFIYPDYYISNAGEKYITGLYPLKPLRVEYLCAEATGELYIRFNFADGKEVTVPQKDIIHWRKDYGVNDYFGGGMCGGNDNDGLLKTLETYNTITQSISEALKCSLSISGVMKYVSVINEDKLKEERDRFVTDLRKGLSTVLFLDNKADYMNIPRDIKLVDKDTIEFFYQSILRSSGVSLPMLNGDYTDSQKSAFYETVLEPAIISLGQATTKCVFTDRQLSYRNEVILYPDQIQNMSIEKRIAWLNVAVPAGAVSKNEIRQTVGLPPIDGGDEYPRGYNNLDSGAVGAKDQKVKPEENKGDENNKEQNEDNENE